MTPGDWYPLCAADALAPGGLRAVRLFGRELVLWRSAAGALQLWDDRCPHRSVRLTLGRVVDETLVCRYHGWRYAAGSGACVHIPSQPAAAPPRAACVPMHDVQAAHGLVWGRLDAGDAAPPPLDGAVRALPCRTVALPAPALLDAARARGAAALGPQLFALGGGWCALQPLDAARVAVHPLLPAAADATAQRAFELALATLLPQPQEVSDVVAR